MDVRGIRLTPPDIYDLLDREFDFRLDAACESSNQLAPNGHCIDLKQDGLKLSWIEYGGAIFCNPPYHEISLWLQKGIEESKQSEHPIVFLVHSDTSTQWWRYLVADKAAEIRFITGRLRHYNNDGTRMGVDPWPSAIIIYNREEREQTTYRYIDRDSLSLGF